MIDDENNIKRLLRCWISGVQSVEDALTQLALMRRIDTATGAQLDVLGRIVGQRRGGREDATFRRYIRARIRANKSRGTIGDVIKVAALVVGDEDAAIVLRNEGRAAYSLVVDGVPLAFVDSLVVLDLVRAATAAGVRVIVESNAGEPADAFAFEGGIGKGFSAFADPSDGGALSSASSS
jgi:hypothetical protein